jgi:hypothetical protein
MDQRDILARLAYASELPELLDAAYDAFAAMLATIEDHQDPDSRFFIPMVYAAASAANGRDHIIRAPSLPPSAAHQAQSAGESARFGDDQDVAGWIAGVSRQLELRLMAAATTATESSDQRACLGAAQYAREIMILMGHQPE